MNQENSSHKDWLSILQFIFSSLAAASLFGLAALLLLLFMLGTNPAGAGLNFGLPILTFAVSTFLSGVLVLPSCGFSLAKLIGRPVFWRTSLSSPYSWLVLPVWVLALLGGNWAAHQPGGASLLLPIFQILAVGLPVLLILSLAFRRLNPGSPQRRWGIFAAGLVLGPALIFILEMAALLVVIVGVFILASTQTGFSAEINRLVSQLQTTGVDLNKIQPIISPYLSDWRLILVVLLTSSVIIPVIEEILKPIGIWFLAKRGLTPAEGLAAGLISGAAYTLFESLTASANVAGDQWLAITLARCGTDALHILTTGVMGWGLASAWSGKRSYLSAGVCYLAAVCLHGLWNGLTMAMTLSHLVEPSYQNANFFFRVGAVAPYGLIFLTLLMLLLLSVAHRFVRDGYRPKTVPR